MSKWEFDNASHRCIGNSSLRYEEVSRGQPLSGRTEQVCSECVDVCNGLVENKRMVPDSSSNGRACGVLTKSNVK